MKIYTTHEPLPKSHFIGIYGYDPTVAATGLFRFQFYDRYGFGPLEPRQLAIEEYKIPQIIVKDRARFYLV